MSRLREVRKFAFQNLSGEEMPPFACFAFDECVDEEGEIILQARKCTADDAKVQNPATLAFNFGGPVPDEGYGSCTVDFPCMAILGDEVDPGQMVGPKEDDWELWASGYAFRARCPDLSEAYYDSDSHRSWLIDINTVASGFLAYTHSGVITGISGTTPGSGVGKLVRKNSSGLLEFVQSDGADVVIDIWNSVSEAGASKYLQLKRNACDLLLYVDVEEC